MKTVSAIRLLQISSLYECVDYTWTEKVKTFKFWNMLSKNVKIVSTTNFALNKFPSLEYELAFLVDVRDSKLLKNKLLLDSEKKI